MIGLLNSYLLVTNSEYHSVDKADFYVVDKRKSKIKCYDTDEIESCILSANNHMESSIASFARCNGLLKLTEMLRVYKYVMSKEKHTYLIKMLSELLLKCKTEESIFQVLECRTILRECSEVQ